VNPRPPADGDHALSVCAALASNIRIFSFEGKDLLGDVHRGDGIPRSGPSRCGIWSSLGAALAAEFDTGWTFMPTICSRDEVGFSTLYKEQRGQNSLSGPVKT